MVGTMFVHNVGKNPHLSKKIEFVFLVSLKKNEWTVKNKNRLKTICNNSYVHIYLWNENL